MVHIAKILTAAAARASLAVFLAVCFTCTVRAAPISFSDLLGRPRPAPTRTIPYGPAPEQYAQLWKPEGKGPHPIVIMIHGGCWLASLPGTDLTAYISEDLRRHGIAVWNIEYRRVGGAGGGYPGTFQDVGHAIDTLRTVAVAEELDLRHAVAVGHSAGGHLALWAAARTRLPRQSVLTTSDPLAIKGVVSLAGIDDLAAYHADGPAACGGPDTIDALVGSGRRSGQDVYADTSPAALLPLETPQVIVSGALDPIVPVQFGEAYAAKAKAAGDNVQVIDIPVAGHFELIDPASAAWQRIEPVIAGLLR